MKNIILIFAALSLSTQVLAINVSVNVRDEKHRLVTKVLDLSNLLDSDQASNSHFEVLQGTSDEVIHLSGREQTEHDKLQAATLVYHLHVARNYFVEVLESEFVKDYPQIKVRINMTKPFNEFYRFVSTSKMDEYNNAVSIPPSNKKAMGGRSWDAEIWFRPAKDDEINNNVYEVAKQFDQTDLAISAATNILEISVNENLMQAAYSGSINSLDYSGIVSGLLTTLGIFKIAPKILMFASEPFKSKTFLDTAMIPEIAYHEFSHVALSDYVSLRHSSPLNEGMANYFAAVINKHEQIAYKNGRHSKNMSGYDGEAEINYRSSFETSVAAHANFVFSFLWGLRNKLKNEFGRMEK